MRIKFEQKEENNSEYEFHKKRKSRSSGIFSNGGSKKSHIIIASAAVSSALIFLILTLISSFMTSSQISQHGAKRWGEGSEIPYAQISCFLTSGSTLTPEQVRQFETTALKKIEENVPKSDNPNAKTIINAYSTEGNATLKSDSGSANVTVTAVGGYFFYIHDMKFLYGAPFSDNDIMLDRLVIDTDTAWKLFGSNDVVGKTITMDGHEFSIAGVVDRERDNLTNEMYGKTSRIYMAYSTYETFNKEAKITCLETIMPNPIKDFASKLVSENVGSGTTEVIENSSRFDTINLSRKIPELSKKGIKNVDIIRPYWENIASVTEFNVCVILIFQIITVSFAIVVIIGYIVYFYIKITSTIQKKLKKPYSGNDN